MFRVKRRKAPIYGGKDPPCEETGRKQHDEAGVTDESRVEGTQGAPQPGKYRGKHRGDAP
jgi:hypothetical protein